MEIERENMIKIGTKVEFNYGAMHPVEYGVITKIENNIATIKAIDDRGAWPSVGFVEEIKPGRIFLIHSRPDLIMRGVSCDMIPTLIILNHGSLHLGQP